MNFKTQCYKELRNDLMLKPFKNEKKFVPLLKTVVSDKIVNCLKSIDKLPKCLFMQRIQKHYSVATRCALKQILGKFFLQLLKVLTFPHPN